MTTLAIEPEPVPLVKDQAGRFMLPGTRISLDVLVADCKRGKTPEAIHEAYETVPLADVYAIFSFYLRHRADIESYLGDRSKSESRCRSGSNRSTRLTGFARHCSPGSIRPRCADSPGMHEALQEHLQRRPERTFHDAGAGQWSSDP